MIPLLLVAAALAQEPASEPGPGAVSTSFTDDFEVRYWNLADDTLPDPSDVHVLDYVEQVNRLNALLAVRKWTFEAQIDEVSFFADRYYLDDELYTEHELVAEGTPNVMPGISYLNPEKLRARYETPKASVVLGDTYAAFGRGIALNLNRNVDIDIDTSIQGAKVVGHPGAWDLTGLIGELNRQQVAQDNPNGGKTLISGDLRHAIAGFRAERFGLGPANLGAHVVHYRFVDEVGWSGASDAIDTAAVATIGGATAELVGVGGLDFYFEGDLFGYTDPTKGGLPAYKEDAGDLGYAIYGSAAAYPGKTVLLLEGKRYYQAERVNALLGGEFYEVAVAPSLEYERAITEDTSAALNSNDVYGGRVEWDVPVATGVTPYVATAVFRDLDLSGLHFNTVPETIVHPMLGLEYIGTESAAIVDAGYRTDIRDNPTIPTGTGPAPVDGGADRLLHGDASVKLPLPAALSLDMAAGLERFAWGNNPLQQNDYTQVTSSVTLAYTSVVAFTWYTDYSDNPLVDSVGNLSENVYGAGELQVKPTSAITLKAFYGAYKAGIRCAGGQCRQLPGFDGARASVVAAF